MNPATETTRPERRQRISSLDFISVWVIEDDKSYRDILVTAINESSDVRCDHDFATCEEVLKILDQDAPPVILMDIGLPKGCMSGIEGTARIKAISPATDVIMLTIHGEDENVFKAIVAGASGYLLKSPTQSFDQILNAIREVVLGGGSPMSPYIAHKVMEMFVRLAKPKSDYGLTEREGEILNLMIEGLTKKQMAERLIRSFHTIDTHIKNIYEKLHVHSNSGAIAKVFQEHLRL